MTEAELDFSQVELDGTAIVVIFWRELEKRYVSGTSSRRQPASYAAYVLQEAGLSQEELKEGHAYWRNELRGFAEENHGRWMHGRKSVGMKLWEQERNGYEERRMV